jgi:ElaB/YqjD/DUF883 family membrane-anchored ribosome-binding protein
LRNRSWDGAFILIGLIKGPGEAMENIDDPSALVARREIRELIFDLETVLEEVGEEGGITVAELRQSLLNTIANIKEHSQVSLMDNARARAHQVRNAIVAVNHFVCDHPWMAVVIGTGMGWLTRSVLVPRRS